jgi:hypothetical protein
MRGFSIFMPTVAFDFAALADLYQRLITLITNEGINHQTNYALRVLDRGIGTIQGALDFKKENVILQEATWQELYKDYKSMYPPHGGFLNTLFGATTSNKEWQQIRG